MKGGIKRDTRAHNALYEQEPRANAKQCNVQNYTIMFKNRSHITQISLHCFGTRISWRAVRFSQDVELVLTGTLIVEISCCSRVDLLQQLYMIRPEYLKRGSWSGRTSFFLNILVRGFCCMLAVHAVFLYVGLCRFCRFSCFLSFMSKK